MGGDGRSGRKRILYLGRAIGISRDISTQHSDDPPGYPNWHGRIGEYTTGSPPQRPRTAAKRPTSLQAAVRFARVAVFLAFAMGVCGVLAVTG